MPPPSGGSLIGGRGDDYIGGVDGVDFSRLPGRGPDKDILIGGYAPEETRSTLRQRRVFTHKGFPDTEPSCGNKKSG